MGYKTNGVDTGGIPEHLVSVLLDKYDIPFLVETGTANGDSVRAMSSEFEKIWTIELIPDRPEVEDKFDNIISLVGDSVELLPQVISGLIDLKEGKERQWVLFYLDAHYSGDTENDTGYPECPLLDEIKAVGEYGEDAIIIIDDARLFLGQPPHPHDPTEWPSIKEIFILLNEKFPYHHITITDDYILAIPLHVRDVIDQEWRDRFHIRYPNEQDKLKSQVKDVYTALKKYIE